MQSTRLRRIQVRPVLRVSSLLDMIITTDCVQYITCTCYDTQHRNMTYHCLRLNHIILQMTNAHNKGIGKGQSLPSHEVPKGRAEI